MKKKKARMQRITSFNFEAGKLLANKYKIVQKLGSGWESEVYLLQEIRTGIECAGKFFFPHRNQKGLTSIRYAKRLHRLRHCPIMIHYFTQEKLMYKNQEIAFLVSEFVDGELLSDFLKRQPRKRLFPFQALHLLHALAKGFEMIHRAGEYHGDLHADNIIIHRYGLGFDLKVLDTYFWNTPKPENRRDDICDIIRVFYDSLGGQKHYSKQPEVVKNICCGLKRSLILKKFRSSSQLRHHLESLAWE